MSLKLPLVQRAWHSSQIQDAFGQPPRPVRPFKPKNSFVAPTRRRPWSRSSRISCRTSSASPGRPARRMPSWCLPALARFSRRRRPPANRRVESRAFAIRSEPGRRPRQFVRFAPLRAESTIRTRGSRTSPQCSSWRLSVSKVRRRLNGQLRSLYFLHPTSVIGSGTCTRSRGLAPKPRAQSQPQQLRAARQASLSRGLTFSPVLFQRLLSGGAFFLVGGFPEAQPQRYPIR